ncbi:MAG TPA: hypothetical protein VD996_02500 [Chitinophagaceae bacterium]|nr:hypothetical protein [Chitinophagaceae bacterium]
MPLINYIPERYEEGFKALSQISEQQFDKVQKSLTNAPYVSSITKLATAVSHIEELKQLDISEMFLSVGSLIPFIDDEEMIDEIVKDIIMLSLEDELVRQEDVSQYGFRLAFLLNNKQMYYASKADSLVNNYGNIFIQCRVVSDIRPVFDIKSDPNPEVGLIIHNLNIHYQSHEEPYHKDISIALTAEELLMLKEAIVRAEMKEKSLQNILKKSGMTNIQ